MLLPERSEYVPCPSDWQQNPNQLSCGNGCMRIADHHDLRRVDWRKHSACYEQNVPICNALWFERSFQCFCWWGQRYCCLPRCTRYYHKQLRQSHRANQCLRGRYDLLWTIWRTESQILADWWKSSWQQGFRNLHFGLESCLSHAEQSTHHAERWPIPVELQLQWNVSVCCCCIAEPPGNHGWWGDFTACRR